MTFRKKLLLMFSLIGSSGVLLSSFMTYRSAKKRLGSAAKEEMERTAALIARQSEIALDVFKNDLQLMAELPLIRNTSRDPVNASLVDETCRYFQKVIQKTRVLQSINIVDREAMCIASSFPDRIGSVPMQRDVLKSPAFHAALDGKTSASQIFVSRGTGRPVILITLPVMENGRPIAAMRAVLDLDYFNNYFIRPQQYVHGGRAYFFDPQLDMSLPEGWKVPNVIEDKKYKAPEIPIPPDLLSQPKGFIRYRSKEGAQLAAFYKTQKPEWLFVVEKPEKEVVEPIRAMGHVTAVNMITMLFAISAGVSIMTRPILERLGQCMALAQEIETGRLDRRLKIKGKDEVARLGRGLNTMADSLEESHTALEEAERMYRGIFENAVEGIFITDPEGLLTNANPALAILLGHDSPLEIVGINVMKYFPEDATALLFNELRKKNDVRNFEIFFHRQDGTERIGNIYARADRDGDGEIVRVQGILDDVTEQRQVEKERRRAEEAQRLFVQSQLEALRYQINPHFLFNVLNSVDALSKNDPGRITGLIDKLSRYLRSTLTSRESGLVPLSEELAVIESYLGLEKVRFEDDLAISVHAPEGITDVMVPELLIQPLVENAVKHGMKTSSMPLEVDVSCREAGEFVQVEVSNTGKWIQRNDRGGKADDGIGLENLRKRLCLTYDNHYDLDIREQGGRVYVTVGIPRRGEANEK